MDIAEFKKHHMDDSAAIAVDVFNSEPWNDKWDKESANEMLSRITKSPYFFGLVCIDEKKVIGFLLGVFEYWHTLFKQRSAIPHSACGSCPRGARF